MSFGEILGLVAGAITTGSLIPQVVKVYQFKSSRDVSLLFTILFLIGDSIWLVYGLINNQLPIILWNILALIFLGILLFGKLKYNKGIPEVKSKAKVVPERGI